jgi:hypothetical protein
MLGFTKEDQLRGRKPKVPGKIKQVSNDAAKRSAEYHRVLDEIDQEREPLCEECEIPEFSHSHLIKRDFNGHAYFSVKKNIRRNCDIHHKHWENGNLWELPKMAPKYLAIVKSLDEQYYRQKVAQFLKNLEKYKAKNWLALSNKSITLPDWIKDYENG